LILSIYISDNNCDSVFACCE